jgi:hypothetical protein
MTSALVATAKLALVAVLLGAMATGMWANSRMIRRARKAGYRYWLLNPMSVVAGLQGIEPLIFIVATLLGVASVIGLIALELGPPQLAALYEAKPAMSPIGTFETCRLRRATSEFEGKAENICSY